MPVVLAETSLELLDMRIVGVDLALCVCNLPVIRPACLSDLPTPLLFAVLVIGPGLVERPPGFLAGSLITLPATEHPLEPSRRCWFEICPLRRRDRYCKLP
jgi:hypothetical protein